MMLRSGNVYTPRRGMTLDELLAEDEGLDVLSYYIRENRFDKAIELLESARASDYAGGVTGRCETPLMWLIGKLEEVTGVEYREDIHERLMSKMRWVGLLIVRAIESPYVMGHRAITYRMTSFNWLCQDRELDSWRARAIKDELLMAIVKKAQKKGWSREEIGMNGYGIPSMTLLERCPDVREEAEKLRES